MDCAKVIEQCEIALIELSYALADYCDGGHEHRDPSPFADVGAPIPALKAARTATLLALEILQSRTAFAEAPRRAQV